MDFEVTWKRQTISYAKNIFSESLLNFVSYKRRRIKYVWQNTYFKYEITTFLRLIAQTSIVSLPGIRVTYLRRRIHIEIYININDTQYFKTKISQIICWKETTEFLFIHIDMRLLKRMRPKTEIWTIQNCDYKIEAM